MTNYVLIGSGKTDENGVAHLDTDANGDPLTHSYTGVGAGEVDVLASLDKPITSSSIVSEIYEVLDGTFFDKGILNDPQTNDNWTNSNNRMTVNRDNEGTLLTSTSAWAYYQANNNNTFTSPLCVEFDVVSSEQTPSIRFKNDNSNAPYTISETGHYKITFGEDSITITVNDVSKQHYIPVSILELPFTVFFEMSDANEKVKYKNFVVYPI